MLGVTMICQREKCKCQFEPTTKKQLFCSKKCCNAQMTLDYRKRLANYCLDCKQPTNAKGGRCRSCLATYKCFLTLDTTLKEHYESLKFASKHPSLRQTQIRLMAKYHNKHLIGLPCQKCGYDKHTNFCHIKPLHSFKLSATIREVNHTSNLLILCPNHHWEFDHGLLKLKDIPKRQIDN